jgi:hypothetical protein
MKPREKTSGDHPEIGFLKRHTIKLNGSSCLSALLLEGSLINGVIGLSNSSLEGQ